MTVNEAEGEGEFFRGVELGECCGALAYRVAFHRQRDSWMLEFSQGNEERCCCRRRRLAIERLCALDAAIELSLRAGHTVRREVQRTCGNLDGAHPATAQVYPLLLPRKVCDALYPYQRQGVAWLLRRKRALLGDDMGLGKTAQALAAVRRLVRTGAVSWSLVVAPRTLIANWRYEARVWAPELTVATALPLGREREAQWRRIVGRAHLVLTSYEQLRSPPTALLANPPDLVIADEAHRLRNIGALSTQGFRALRVERVWALTGTPLERDAEDLAVLLSLLDSSRFAQSDKGLPTTSLRARLRPYLLRT